MGVKIRPWLVLISCFAGSLGAQSPQDQAPAQPGAARVVELEGIKIDVRQEMPSVTILGQRVKADFEEVRVDKDFQAELVGQTEKIVFHPITSGRVTPIRDVERLLSKKRF